MNATELSKMSAPQRIPIKPLLGLVAIIAVMSLILSRGAEIAGMLEQFNGFVQEIGWVGPLVFILGYASAVVAFVPGSLLTAASGAIFGIGEGTLYVFIGASLGACVAFLIARYLARTTIEQRLARNPKFKAVDRAIGQQGRKIVFLLRLSPVFPFTPLNYLLGLTKVSFRDYAIACLGMLPGTLLYVYLGKVAQEVASLGGGQAHKSPAEIAFLIFGLVVTALVTILITRTAKRALGEATHVE